MILDEYRKGWALRYIREAKDELKTSSQTPQPLDLIIDAARKAQTSIYFSLGEPSFIGSLISEVSEAIDFVENPVLRCLIGIERTVKQIEKKPGLASEEALKRAHEIVWAASEILETVFSDD